MYKNSKENSCVYSQGYKQQVVSNYLRGKSKYEIIRNYNINELLLEEWITECTGCNKKEMNSFKEGGKLIQLHKENQQLKQDINILKHATRILLQEYRIS